MIISNVCKTFQNQQVLDEANLDLSKAQAHGLLGANGAGKSTLIKIIMNLGFADAGEVVKPASVSFLPENPYLPLNLTAFQIVSHACAIQNRDDSSALLHEVALKKSAWHKPIRTYSKGMKQRTAIAYALAGNPEWLLLDEPMSGLDAMGRKHMLDVFQQRKEDKVSILMCSHAVTDLVRLCEEVHIMAQGKIVESIAIQQHSMQEVELLEERLQFWSTDYAVD